MFELEVKGGSVVKIFKNQDNKAVIEYDGVDYELESMINLIEEVKNNYSSVSEAEIQQFERDPEMRKMIEDSEQDIERGKVHSTKDVLARIRRGEI
ncbi:hypothetical protein MM300_19835 [Evansella sp. LMS18]|jgi:hypothetical protein|uniref:hypothetical protein n=1 Tax=Evansella sp. LMS18 TaxID=2924033 RepID=UPI0020D040DD|nr:hypothetical protein [Evansella sp. LMS18]UTR10103.1 hypothetical protein MM300_19835 [Evansella sp. LMS18]